MKPLREMTTFDADEMDALKTIGWNPSHRSSCPDPSLLIAATSDVLDEATANVIRSHAATCPSCKQLTSDLTQLLEAEPTGDERDRIRARVRDASNIGRPPILWRFAPAGLVAAAAIAGIVVGQMSQVSLPHVDLQPPALIMARAEIPTVFGADRPQITQPEVELTLRGEPTSASLPEQLNKALDVADAGNVAGALARLTILAQRNPSSIDAQVAFGAALIRAGRAVDAVPVLARAQTLSTRPSDEVDWFFALALVQSHETARATAVLEPLCQRSGWRGAQACVGLAELRRQSSSAR